MKCSSRRRNLCRLAVVLGALYLPVSASGQEEHEDDGLEHGLHFFHPIFTESISPDTKVRLDFGREWETSPGSGPWIWHSSSPTSPLRYWGGWVRTTNLLVNRTPPG